MRIPSYERGQLLRHRVFIAMTRFLGAEIDDVGKAAMKRPAYFGVPVLRLGQAILRGRSAWTVGERELLAAVVSRANDCPFCVGTHSAIAAGAIGSPLSAWEDGAYGARVTAACRFVEKLTRDPDAIGADDVTRAREAGVEDTALVEAIYVAFFFNVMNRIANALEFTHRSETDRLRGASMLRRMGYRLPAFLMRSHESASV